MGHEKSADYGNGRNVRDWLFVEDHCEAIDRIVREADDGETFNVGGRCELQNLELARLICRELDTLVPAAAPHERLLTFVTDRPGHDRRYALDTTKLRGMGWAPKADFDEGLASTVEWYRERRDWWEPIKSGEYADWYATNYAGRSATGE